MMWGQAGWRRQACKPQQLPPGTAPDDVDLLPPCHAAASLPASLPAPAPWGGTAAGAAGQDVPETLRVPPPADPRGPSKPGGACSEPGSVSSSSRPRRAPAKLGEQPQSSHRAATEPPLRKGWQRPSRAAAARDLLSRRKVARAAPAPHHRHLRVPPGAAWPLQRELRAKPNELHPGPILKTRGDGARRCCGHRGHPTSCPHSPRGLDQGHGAQPQHHRPPRVADFLDGGDLQQLEPFNQVKTCGAERRG